MFDTMTLTKIVGGLCGTFLVFLLGGWAAEEIYHMGGHDGEHAQAYTIPVESAEGEEVAEEEAVPFEEVYAMADAAEGESLWRACQSCHKLEDGQNGTGPHLYGIVGRQVASVADFSYSGSLIEANPDAWTPEELNAFLIKPSDYAPGTNMSYNGMRDATDRANLIAYLDTIGG